MYIIMSLLSAPTFKIISKPGVVAIIPELVGLGVGGVADKGCEFQANLVYVEKVT